MNNEVNDMGHQDSRTDKKPWSTPQVLTQSMEHHTFASKVGGTYETMSHVIGPNSAS